VTVAFAMLLFGALLLYGGWRGLSIPALLRGDNKTPKAKSAKVATPS
jgi:hypothetical protein